MERVGFYDYSLKIITVVFDEIVFTIDDDDVYEIRCSNFIGLNYLGQWDENIISEIEISESDLCINQCLDIIVKNNDVKYKDGVKNFDFNWKCLKIKLIDDVVIKVVCEKIEFVKISEKKNFI